MTRYGMDLSREDIQAVADATSEDLGIPKSRRPRFHRWNKRRGWARTEAGTFSLPEWLMVETEDHLIAYIVHEVVHFAGAGLRHGPLFTRTENRALKAWGLKAVRRSRKPAAYMAVLGDLDGRILPVVRGGVYAGYAGKRRT